MSALINPGGAPARVRTAMSDGRFTLVVSEPMLAELDEVLARPSLARKYRITAEDRIELPSLLREAAELISVSGDLKVCRDHDDDIVIETAVRGYADVLVTRDDDLKDAMEVILYLEAAGVAVVTVRRFLELLDQDR
ncbi:MAG: putative toxin-antitoxin system toxin component, PIN family [Dehalococcoidia bacterium]